MVFRAGKTEKLELNRALRSDVASLAGDEAAWGDKRTCADVGPKPNKASFATRAAFFDPVVVAQGAWFQRNTKTFEPTDERRSLRTEAYQPKVESKFPPLQ